MESSGKANTAELVGDLGRKRERESENGRRAGVPRTSGSSTKARVARHAKCDMQKFQRISATSKDDWSMGEIVGARAPCTASTSSRFSDNGPLRVVPSALNTLTHVSSEVSLAEGPDGTLREREPWKKY